MQPPQYLIVPFLQAFFWLDDGLQKYLQSRGWSQVTRPQSKVMINVLSGVTRPSDIARNMNVSRQAIHSTINQMIEMGMLRLTDDPNDRRSKVLAISGKGVAMQEDANRGALALQQELERRIGKANMAGLFKAFSVDWGAPPEPATLDAPGTSETMR